MKAKNKPLNLLILAHLFYVIKLSLPLDEGSSLNRKVESYISLLASFPYSRLIHREKCNFKRLYLLKYNNTLWVLLSNLLLPAHNKMSQVCHKCVTSVSLT